MVELVNAKRSDSNQFFIMLNIDHPAIWMTWHVFEQSLAVGNISVDSIESAYCRLHALHDVFSWIAAALFNAATVLPLIFGDFVVIL